MADRTKKKRRGERPDGLIQVSIQIGYKPDGRPDRKYFYGHTRAEAERKRDEYKARHTAGVKLNPNMTVREWVEICKATYRGNINEAYLKNDDAPYSRLVKDLGKMRLVDILEIHLQKSLDKISGMSFSTVSKYYYTVKRVFKKAKKNKLILEDPSEDLRMPHSTRGTHRALERWEIELIFAHWNDTGVRFGLPILLMLLCGLRRGEVIGLSWQNVNLEAKTILVCDVAVIKSNQSKIEHRTKTDAGVRVLPICQTLYDALSAIPNEKRTGLVCLSANGKPLTESGFYRGMESFEKAITRIANGELPIQTGKRNDLNKSIKATEEGQNRITLDFLPHDLRHTYATALYDAGVPVKAAQYFLGHSDIRITLELYTHLSKERESASRMQTVEYLDKWVDMKNLDTLKTVAIEAGNEQFQG